MNDHHDRNDRSSVSFSPRLIVGLFIALAGALLLLDNLGWIDSRHIFHFWPVALIAFGIVNVLQPRRSGRGGSSRGFGVVLIFVGTWLLLARLGWAALDTDLLWPALILLVGANLVWREITRGRRGVNPGTDPADRIDGLALLGRAQQTSTSQAFRGGTATAIFGGCVIDLRQALLAEQGADIDAFAMWGGVDVIVPDHWNVVVRGTPILGAVANYTRQLPGPEARTLVVHGFALMGGVEVLNRPKDER